MFWMGMKKHFWKIESILTFLYNLDSMFLYENETYFWKMLFDFFLENWKNLKFSVFGKFCFPQKSILRKYFQVLIISIKQTNMRYLAQYTPSIWIYMWRGGTPSAFLTSYDVPSCGGRRRRLELFTFITTFLSWNLKKSLLR